ncbi:MAG TPA: D-alanyl-D-alanine carboxypeptidase/D-alanyl-D-alanine-endopeptidase [Melioribacteraceae bacterium]|mgnify:CR=1 FL=1|nr:D-alanyl-D-alanine carboxypeptidase/D-alanyl-D-alanine-endopeptidase [Melioribacteraceae bacterium]
MKKYLLLLVVFMHVSILYAQNSYDKIKFQLDSLLNDDYFKSCNIAIDAYNLTNEKQIYGKNEKLLMRPASNQKVLTTATALQFLGGDYKFATSIYYTGKINDDVLEGDVYFVGGFDPDFSINDLSVLVGKLKNSGITKIKGKIYADISAGDSLFWGEGWMWDDDPSSDFPSLTPLVINDNCVYAAFKPSKLKDKPIVELIPSTKYANLINNAITDTITENFDIVRNWVVRGNDFKAIGKLNINESPDTFKINIFDGNAYFMTLAIEEMNKQGIKTQESFEYKIIPQDAIKIYTIERAFKDVIDNLNKQSDNLSAEMTLRAIALQYFGKPATPKNGVKLIDSLITLAGLNPKNYRLADGSGVSYYNLISAEMLNAVVKYMYQNNSTGFRMLYNSFPIGGIDGTLRGRMKEGNCYNNVHAKTGTLSGVSTLTGYLTAKNGALISFSILTQNFVGSSRTVRNYQDKICEILSNLE